jgi:glycosyltransferase involved in cell wall biosynthesis
MRSWTVLRVHNFYRQPGGEDGLFEAEERLLKNAGHAVVRYEDRNDRIVRGTPATGLNTIWSRSSYRSLERISRARQLDIAHFHNTFPLVSPSAYYAVKKHSVPVVQTLHNYRLLCPAATFYRDGSVCEECLTRRSFTPAVRYGCYRNSRPATAAVAAMLIGHRTLGTWMKMVDVYVALSEFARRKYVEGGFPEDQIVVKPNFVDPDPGIGAGGGGYALFVGRLSEEKGVRLLAHAWSALGEIPLWVAGDGPLNDLPWPKGTVILGNQPHPRIIELMKAADVLICPSGCYECAPLAVLEAFACGLPVIASDLGALTEMVADRRTGLLFRSGDAVDLAQQVRWAFQHPAELSAMRIAARGEFQQKYTADRNSKMIVDIYEQALNRSRRCPTPAQLVVNALGQLLS